MYVHIKINYIAINRERNILARFKEEKETLTWKSKITKVQEAKEIIFCSVHSSIASKHPCSFIIFERSVFCNKAMRTKKGNNTSHRT